MILHMKGQDTLITYAWDDSGDLGDGDVQPNEIEFTVLAEDGSELIAWTLLDEGLQLNSDYSFDLLIPDDQDIPPGNHEYSLRALDPARGSWIAVSGGLFRVKDFVLEATP